MELVLLLCVAPQESVPSVIMMALGIAKWIVQLVEIVMLVLCAMTSVMEMMRVSHNVCASVAMVAEATPKRATVVVWLEERLVMVMQIAVEQTVLTISVLFLVTTEVVVGIMVEQTVEAMVVLLEA